MTYNTSLRSNSNYPPMTQLQWESAPFNERDIPERDFDIAISQTLSKDLKVTTDDYTPIHEEELEEGRKFHFVTADTSETDWNKVYSEIHYTPAQLIGLFKQCLEENLKNGQVFKTPRITERLIEECNGWEEDETIVFDT